MAQIGQRTKAGRHRADRTIHIGRSMVLGCMLQVVKQRMFRAISLTQVWQVIVLTNPSNEISTALCRYTFLMIRFCEVIVLDR
jgi:hypothetical protein